MDCPQKGVAAGLPPPPSFIPTNVVPIKPQEPLKRVAVARRGLGTKGQKVALLANHFKVNVAKTEGHFYHYSVAIAYEDGTPVEAKGIGRTLIEKVQTTYHAELDKKSFAYDGEKSLFTVGALPQNKFQFTIVLDERVTSNRNMLSGGGHSPDDGEGDSPNATDKKRSKRQPRSKTYKVVISYATIIPLQAIASALRGEDSEHFQEAVRVLDIILRQHAAKRGCLLVRQSFFHNTPRNFSDIGGGVNGCRGFHSSFRATQGGLSLNVDVSTTMTVHPGPVDQFLLKNQNVRDHRQIDWVKAKRMLKNLRITVAPANTEHKITGLSDQSCRFSFKQRREDQQNVEISVYDYFAYVKKIPLTWSGDYPCINTGKPKRPVYVPLEHCSLVSLQRYTKSLNSLQRASLVEKSRQGPKDRMAILNDALRTSNYNADPLLGSCGVSMSNQFTRVEGRILPAPKLAVGNGVDFFPRDGRWNFNNKKLVEPATIGTWVVVNFSFRCDMNRLIQDLIRCGGVKGVMMEKPYTTFEENPQYRRSPPYVRVEKMVEMVKQRLSDPPLFILCILPDRKNSDLYGPWKKKMLADIGIVTQCIVPAKFNDQYLTNVLLKINAKMGGINSLLTVERSPSIPVVSRTPTLIVGMDVSHGSPGRADVPSIAAVVSSRQWPLISRYRASVRTQSPKMEMVGCLFKKVSVKEDDGVFKDKDEGVFRELLQDFYRTSGSRKPEQIIIFRDGVSESQFSQVLNIELEQMIEACRFLDDSWSPKFMVVIAQKNHHTRFFLENNTNNVPPGTIIDNGVCHPRTNDFYMCAHAGRIGTTRPTHYHVLYDELGFSPDDLQELVHSLSYVYQRSTTAISIVAPICYAHLAASQMSQFIKFDEMSETQSSSSSSHGGVQVQDLPPLHKKVAHTMFFC